jgi:ABC-2 type transport system ATP-binding protein
MVGVLVLAALVVLGVANAADKIRSTSQFMTGADEAGKPIRLDTTIYYPASTPAPAVLLAHGFGGTKDSVAGEATTLARHGFMVLTWTARGFGRSGGDIHLDQPGYEVADARRLVDRLVSMPQVEKRNGVPQLAVAGSSYGGGLALLLAGYDHRIRAVAADITWNNLEQALFPNYGGSAPGVFKRLWTGELFGGGFSALNDDVSCGRFAPDACAAYQDSARTGRPTPELRTLLRQASPSSVLDRITAPTLLTQGEQDSLFPLDQADANARGIAAHGTPVKVYWRTGGHDSLSAGSGAATAAAIDWFHRVFAGQVHGRQGFAVDQQSGSQSQETGNGDQRRLEAAGYPVSLQGPAQRIAAPAGGVPAAVTSIPGLSGVLGQFGGLTSGLSIVPGQTAGFVSAPVRPGLSIAGGGTVRLTVTAQRSGDVTLFVALRDVGGGLDLSLLGSGADSGAAGDALGAVGQLAGTLPSQLVSPVLLRGMRAGVPRTVAVHLPSIVHTVPSGDRVAVTVATTDFAFQNQQAPNVYTVALAAGSVAVPTVSGTVVTAGNAAAWLITGIVVCLLVALLVTLELRRRRRVVRPDPDLADVPVSIRGLVKEYAGGYRAVDDVSFRVERGQVVGLLGPNGAGKTTALRVLVGLITPTEGAVHVFGDPVLPGAPVLARLGAFIEGPGFLPHLSGRDNLRLYWAATGRPDDEAFFAIALDIAGLGSSLDRRVKTYSHGMKQRLGIAQAMLGLPELLVLDEPTNGLDPPQIAEMREVMQRYAETGRTVVVSSHLLAEVEQTCTHVVVMHKGQLVATGSVAEIAGAGGVQLAVDDPDEAARVLQAAGIAARTVPARRALEDVFLDLIGADE